MQFFLLTNYYAFWLQVQRKTNDLKQILENELAEKEIRLKELAQREAEMAKKLSRVYLTEYEQKVETEKLFKVN